MDRSSLSALLITALTSATTSSASEPVASSPRTLEFLQLPVDSQTESPRRPRWYHDAERGWFWYEAPPEDRTLEEAEQVLPLVAAEPADPLAELATLQGVIERAKARAVLHPTEANVRAWMALNAVVQRRATLFADVTQRVVWATPSLDQSLVRPHSQAGLKAWTAARTESRARTLREIAKNHGLLFVFASDCPYCIEMSPYLKRFAQSYGFTVIPISLDGGTVPEFPEARYTPTIRTRLDVAVTPAIFLANPASEQVQPIAYGVVSLSELETRIVRLFTMPPGEMTYSMYDNRTSQP